MPTLSGTLNQIMEIISQLLYWHALFSTPANDLIYTRITVYF